MFLILTAAFVGTTVAVPFLWTYGVIATLLLSPCCGSLLALLATAWVTRSARHPALTVNASGSKMS